jgi:hypothetical protein
MSATELLIKEIETLPGDCVAEVLDFVGYLKQKHSQIGIDGECPLDHTPNAVTIAAMEEGDAMLRWEIPADWYHSPDDIKKALHS